LSERFCAVLCSTVVHNDMHTYEQFLKINIDLGLRLVFLYVCLGLAFCAFFWLSIDCFVLVLFAFLC